MDIFLKIVCLLIFLEMTLCSANAGTTTLTTYYPAPAGNYDKLFAHNIGIGTLDPETNLDVNGDALIRGRIIASEFKTSNKASVVTIILFDQNGVKRTCPAGYALIGQWVSSNGGDQFLTKDYFGNEIPPNTTGVIGLCSAI